MAASAAHDGAAPPEQVGEAAPAMAPLPLTANDEVSGGDMAALEPVPAPSAAPTMTQASVSMDSSSRQSTPAGPPPPPPDVAPALPGADRPAGPILVYRASFLLSVYEVENAQATLKKSAQELGGFVSQQSDTALMLRVPAAKFEQALRAVELAGKVRARNVQAIDVGNEYHDLTIRLRTAEAVHARLESMLERAQNVADALRVEAELERVVREIERLKGQLRLANDQIALSTLSIEFRPESRPDLDDSEVFHLPYPWLDELGLHQLLELTP